MKKQDKKTIPKDIPKRIKWVKAAQMFVTTEIKNGKQTETWSSEKPMTQ